MTNDCKTIIKGVTGDKSHPHYWMSLVKDKRQCTFCNKYQFHDFDDWGDQNIIFCSKCKEYLYTKTKPNTIGGKVVDTT